MCLFFIAPFGVVVKYAFTKGLGSDEFAGLENFKKLISNAAFQLAAKNTLTFSAIAVPLSVILAIALALMLECRIPGKSFFRSFFLSPLMVPVASIVLVWQVLFNNNGTVNVLLKDDALPVTRGDARRTMQLKRETPALGWMLVLDGELCHDAIRRLGLTGEQVERTVKDLADCRLREVFYLHRSPGGGLQLQKKRFAGGERFVREAQNE